MAGEEEKDLTRLFVPELTNRTTYYFSRVYLHREISMDLYGQKSKSVPQKMIINAIEIILLWLSWWILFSNGGAWCEQHLHIPNVQGHAERRWIILVFNIIIFLRLAYMMIFLLKRKIPWEESISVPLAFAIYFIGFPLFVLPVSKAIDALDYSAVVVFITGCILNSAGEIMRNNWKNHPENKGRIYTGGLFRYSRHINYFGDLLWVTGYAMITRNIYSIIVPAFLFCFFTFYNAPKLDKYLAGKYGDEYRRYAAETKMLIPFLF